MQLRGVENVKLSQPTSHTLNKLIPSTALARSGGHFRMTHHGNLRQIALSLVVSHASLSISIGAAPPISAVAAVFGAAARAVGKPRPFRLLELRGPRALVSRL